MAIEQVNRLYPLLFHPVYKDKIWGGTAIAKYKGIALESSHVGESWEISAMSGDESVVAEGPLKGATLGQLVRECGSELLGKHVEEVFGREFPLLVKLIDANDDLSVQVHPDDEYARQHHNSRGKTEMWYVLDATPDATILAGWRKQTNGEQLREIVKSDEVLDYLDHHHAKRGEVFFLPAGRVHTIGKGCLILEIQQASDVTYRLFDFNRVDAEGNRRELHIDRSIDVLDFSLNKSSDAAPYDREVLNEPVLLAHSKYFHTSSLRLDSAYELPVADRDSFSILFVLSGDLELRTDAGSYALRQGQPMLIPASIEVCELVPTDGEVHVVDCYVPYSTDDGV